MHVRKAMRRKGTMVVLPLVLLVAALAIATTGLGSTGAKHAQGRRPDLHRQGRRLRRGLQGEGEHPREDALPGQAAPVIPSARNIALAGLGRSDRPVNQALALQCWKNNGCSTGTGGKLTVAYIEQFGENVYRQMSKMEFILQALTYKDVGKIIYKSAHSDLNQGIADFKAAIAQKVSLIVSYPDFGDAMLPVMKEATDAGIPVATYAWGYVTGPGTNYLTVVGEDTCNLGKVYAQLMNAQVKSGEIAFLGGFPGNPLSAGWQKCELPGPEPEHQGGRTGADELGSVQGAVGRRGHSRRAPEHQGLELRIRPRHGAGRGRGVQGRGQAVQLRADAQDRRRRHGLYVQR